MAEYRAPTRDMLFVLNEVLDDQRIRDLPGYDDYEPETVSAVLDEAARFASDVLSPLNRPGDSEGVHWSEDGIVAAQGFGAAYGQYVEGGWNGLTILSMSALTLAVAVCFLAVACGGGERQPAGQVEDGGRLRVITSTAILADLVKNVGGDRVEVRAIVPPGADAHSFQTTPEDSIAVSRAQVMVTNGFGLDSYLELVFLSVLKPGAVHVIAAEGLEFDETDTSLPHLYEQAAGDGEGTEDEHGRLEGDPHFWSNPVLAIHYVERIRDGLVRADPDGAPDYLANANTYIDELWEVDREIARTLNRVRPEFRHLVTFHDAFGHFARRYGWRVSAFVSSDAGDVSPGSVVQILERIRDDLLPAIFVEPQFRSDVVRLAAADAGVNVATIYSDLSETGVTSYLDMMRANAKSLADNLN